MRSKPTHPSDTASSSELAGMNHNETLVSAAPVIRRGTLNHNETLVSTAPIIRAGLGTNHNETVISVAPARGNRVVLPAARWVAGC